MTVIVGYGDRFERLAEELRSKFNLTNSDSEIFASMTKRLLRSIGCREDRNARRDKECLS